MQRRAAVGSLALLLGLVVVSAGACGKSEKKTPRESGGAGGADAGRGGRSGSDAGVGGSRAGRGAVAGDDAGGAPGASGGAPGGEGGAAGAGARTGGASGEGGSGEGGAGNLPPTGPEGRSCSPARACAGVSCCESRLVPGGSVPMGQACTSGEVCPTDTMPEHPATVASFYLDRFEVTVGRFRSYVDAYDGSPPAAGSGAHPRIPGSGWESAYSSDLAPSRMDLETRLSTPEGFRSGGQCVWTLSAPDVALPVNCVGWAQAFAFCIWDGGRLPTEAEWEYAAAGGAENRRFPWGDAPVDSAHASYGCGRDGNSACELADLPPVGSTPPGRGRFGHEDLLGSVMEWVLDWYDSGWYGGGGADCTNCARVAPPADARVMRGAGGVFVSSVPNTVIRGSAPASTRTDGLGFRCARDP